MADPGPAQRKLAQALGLAVAAPVALGKAREEIDDPEIRVALSVMQDEALEARDRCLDVAAGYGEEMRAEIVALAHDFEDKAGTTVRAWIRPATGAVERAEVLAMLEAAEVATWQSLALAGAGDLAVEELARWGLPVQRRHLDVALDACRRLAEARRDAEGREAAT